MFIKLIFTGYCAKYQAIAIIWKTTLWKTKSVLAFWGLIFASSLHPKTSLFQDFWCYYCKVNVLKVYKTKCGKAD